MSAYPTPNNTFTGEYYNPISYITVPDNVALINKSNNFELLQSCSAVQPSILDNSTIIPNTSWVQNAIIAGQDGEAQINESNTFTELQYCSATKPTSTDNSTIIPNTIFVQNAISTGITNNQTTFLNTGHNYTQLQTCSATMPTSSDNSAIIPTTSWVQSAVNTITNQVVLTSAQTNTTT